MREEDQFLHTADPDLIAFLRDQVRSLIDWDVLQFFHHNPHTIEPAVQIARSLGREESVVSAALERLVERELLLQRTSGSVRIYQLTQDAQLRDDIERFMRACDDPQFRRGATQYLLRTVSGGR
jgi:DNA-binding MarR family transcriptional regulator